MTILNQNRDILINFDNIVGIQVNNSRLEMVISNNEGIIIGKYKNKERAKEVLEEIVNKYTEYLTINNPEQGTIGIYDRPKVYEMPEE